MRSSSVEHTPRRYPRLALEIAIVLAIKGLLLYGIWMTWFSHPATEHMQLPPDEVARRVLTSQPGAGAPPIQQSLPATQSENPRE